MSDKQDLYKISEELICNAAMKAALGVKGVVHLSDSLAENISKKIVGKESIPNGVKLTRDKDILTIDIFVVAEYGTKIPQLAWDIQNAVKKSVSKVSNNIINAVNIHVDGVTMPNKFRSIEWTEKKQENQ